MNWPPRGREKSIVNSPLTHSEYLNLSEECMARSTKILGNQVSEGTMRNVVHQDLEYKSHTFLGEAISLCRQKQLKRIFQCNLRTNADAYVKTLQILVKPSIDSVANGKPCLQTKLGSIPQSSQNPGLDGREFLSSCHTKPMSAS
ncbi:hypothetical protein ACTXT7_000054 [Hymenolepis weldensis]